MFASDKTGSEAPARDGLEEPRCFDRVRVAGTAVGAVVGFGIGMGASGLDRDSGVVDGTKAQMGEFLTENFEKPLDEAWVMADGAIDSVKGVGSAVANRGRFDVELLQVAVLNFCVTG